MPPPKPVPDVITAGPGPGPDPAQLAATAAAEGRTGAEPAKQDPTAPEGEAVAALNAVVADYAKAVSTSVALLGPTVETAQTALREAEAHPELPMGPAMAGNMREALLTLERVYEILRRVGAPSAPQG